MKKSTILIFLILWIIAFYIAIIDFIVYSTASPFDLFGYELGGTFEGGISKFFSSLITFGSIILIAMILFIIENYITRNKKGLNNNIQNKGHKLFWNIIRLFTLLLFTFISLPWIFALNGIYISDIPLLNMIFIAKKPGIGPYISEIEKYYPSVHLGEHHGFDGFIFITYAILLSFLVYKMNNHGVKLISIYGLGCILSYGTIAVLEDFIREQILKRGIYPLIYTSIKFMYEYILLFTIGLGCLYLLLNLIFEKYH
ncbi:MAG: hypothetical protein ACTSRP_06835 [Candidatus Helarchaeota archaeon]